MIHPKVVAKIEKLLAEGNLTMTKIALQLKVSRGSVSAIAHGKRRLKLHRNIVPLFYKYALDHRGNKIYYPTGMTGRCPECGGRVQLPCLACQIRRVLKSDKNNETKI